MKSQHQIKFKKRRQTKPKPKAQAKIFEAVEESLNVVSSDVVVGEREMKFARALSDTEKRVRDASLLSLQSWLAENGENMCTSEVDKLWKGLFYCIWMADKRPIITATIKNVVNLTDVVGWSFMDGLFSCLSREWFGIDRHRVDKFYELANAALDKGVERITMTKDESSFTESFVTFTKILDDRVLQVVKKTGVGLALHVLDVYVDRFMIPVLARAAELGYGNSQTVFEELMETPLNMVGYPKGQLPSIDKRIRERILRRIVDIVSVDELRLEKATQRTLVEAISDKVFAVAARKQTPDDIRKDLYDLRLDLKAFIVENGEEGS